MNYGLKGLSILSVFMVFSGLIWFSSEVAAESYSFAIGGFGNKVKFTNVSGDSTVQVSQSIGDYLFDELQFCPSMKLYDVTPLGSQAGQMRFPCSLIWEVCHRNTRMFRQGNGGYSS